MTLAGTLTITFCVFCMILSNYAKYAATQLDGRYWNSWAVTVEFMKLLVAVGVERVRLEMYEDLNWDVYCRFLMLKCLKVEAYE